MQNAVYPIFSWNECILLLKSNIPSHPWFYDMISLSTSQSQTNDTPSLLCIHLGRVCGSQHPSLIKNNVISLRYIGGQEVMFSLSFTQPSFSVKGSGTEVPFGIMSNFAFSFSVVAIRSTSEQLAWWKCPFLPRQIRRLQVQLWFLKPSSPACDRTLSVAQVSMSG